MDQTQNRAVAALQPFLHLALTAKSPSPRVLADLIVRATSAPGTFVFAELLQTPAIQSLRSEETPQEFKNHLTALQIFSHGTLADYLGTPDLPALSPAQKHKLALLTLLSLASEPYALTYDHLISALHLSSPSDLESLTTEAIYNGLITARLSPTSTPRAVHITSVAPLRDLRPNSLPDILRVLQVWENRCTGVVNEIEAQIMGIRNSAARRESRDRQRQDTIEHAVLNPEVAETSQPAPGSIGSLLSSPSLGQRRVARSSNLSEEVGAGGAKSRKGGIGSKRDIDAQQEDEGGGDFMDEDGGVDVGMARMEVDEGAGSAKLGEGRRNPKRAAGKKSSS